LKPQLVAKIFREKPGFASITGFEIIFKGFSTAAAEVVARNFLREMGMLIYLRFTIYDLRQCARLK
jgi:hypothetical protein